MNRIIVINENNFIIKCDDMGNGGYNVVPLSVDPQNMYDIEEIKEFVAQHPELVLDMNIVAVQKLEAQVRQQRNMLIEKASVLRDRARDEQELQLPATIALQTILEYIQALRDVPEQEGFPNNVVWPVEPTKEL